MQPPEPTTGPAPQVPAQRPAPVAAPGGPAPAGRKGPNRRLRLVLALIGGVAVLLCLGGVGVVVSLYDEATEIKRSEPDVVADSFLVAYLTNRDDKQAGLFLCGSPDLTAMQALRAEIAERESRQGRSVSVTWGALQRAAAGAGQEDVTAVLTVSGFADGQMTSSRDDTWRLHLVDGDGWRVCDADKIS